MESQYPGVRVEGRLHFALFMAAYISNTDQIIKKNLKVSTAQITLILYSEINVSIKLLKIYMTQAQPK